MSLPTTKVEIAFDSGFSTAEGSRTWTDVSAYVEGDQAISIAYGRADELATPDANTCSVTLDNRDGRFTPAKALLTTGGANPYYPNVKKGKPLRVTVTYNSVNYVRFTGYINEWPLVWPDGSSAAATVTITAASRRARLGQTAPLTSAIRAAYLATDPVAYWPMDEEYGTIPEFPDSLYFRDVSNLVDNPNPKKREYITTFWSAPALQPVIHDGSQGPTDETSLVRMPLFTDPNLVNFFPHYVGGGDVFAVNTAGAMTFEAVARIVPAVGADTIVTVMDMVIPGLGGEFFMAAATNSSGSFVTASMYTLDPITRAVVEDHTVFDVTGYNPSLYAAVTDGEVHHWASTLNGTAAVFYVDGVSIGTMTMGATVPSPFASVAIGPDSYNANVWVGHAAVHDRALSAAEILAHAEAATAVTETPSERVVRVAGRVGVPSAEIDVETSLTTGLGAQPEAGRSAAEVLDEVATSTGGVLYDTRAGHLAMQARNHRYNEASSFTLSATTQEVEGDLTVVDDHRYTVNTVEYARASSGDATVTITDSASIANYGVFSQSHTVVSASDTEVEAFAQNILVRYADPPPRVSTVSTDLVNLSTAQRALVLAADIGTRFGISALPGQAPTDPMYLFFEGATESISHGSHTMTINTTPADVGQNVFILDNATYGVLDVNVLAY